MASAISLSQLPRLSASLRPSTPPRIHYPHSRPSQFHLLRPYPVLRAVRRPTNSSEGSDVLLNESRRWGQIDFGDDEDEFDEDDDQEEDDRSLDLLVRFFQNIFRMVSKRARKAVRSVLPVAISTKLVGFSVNGGLILAFLWVLKAFIEVICTLGSVVFVSILLIRGVWSGVAYLQENRSFHLNQGDEDQPAWTGPQPVA